ncbi:tRNA(5-methylaminomethyl-2-thiouridylate)-methyltransferase [Mycoplasmopsis californica HAZ160_1]|uniref:tRNA-specific 2-thiouridylase MnmA n=1 Tax=Mycoplasmopsis californica HAZ160_1 TaxID=1397850 RepID=A0AAT9F7N9_9BACT|nr:tRNA 2-thiouridine(34) synthase MnmA [Mycoplasmopsis californica]BAP00891.1 tRNA(5-methylaminomethyl-2-thiouridylate)-methyltransferase [Mycoplasmopsis californica HAZ160_1]BBG40750.1 tRNA(5-methylaminomethyl-2-thiouridylate)-methyltransferase [Mycoplasmopsis californica]BBG41344.1 tRNA(5-methylaminomethyl-2-thiouridylate)-methyltransferase [Mycoplasmopsis californica]BBG41937.1 tRNA(5-methylaminomethyl-2-thiouridylate)-methyltransferase [Mycoplasmopsis californica]BBG42527.1 tRNA(5-methyla
MKKKVILGMSGGVDSSVAAALLIESGYDVEGLFMRNWDSYVNNDFLGNEDINKEICPQEQDYQDALAVAQKLNIKLHRVDFIKEYWDNVFENFISEYKKGRTPNPDILCNKYIKFSAFADYAFNVLRADYIAMGHYADVREGHLYRAKDQNKDQTYFLAQLSNQQLQRVIMPLASFTKEQIRQKAASLGLVTATKKDSTGICFIGERNFTKFLQNYIPAQPGKTVSIVSGEAVGTHDGCYYYTLGQRKGLNLGGMSEPHYVCGHDVAQNIVYVAPASDMSYLESDALIASGLTLNNTDYNPENLSAKFRYRQNDIKVKIEILPNNHVKVIYPDKSQAVTPGQQVVIYDGQKCIGGATIEKIFLNNTEKTYV